MCSTVLAELRRSNNNPRRGSHYALHTTGHFQNTNVNIFGGHMAGVSNPIVTSFNTWPVCKQPNRKLL